MLYHIRYPWFEHLRYKLRMQRWARLSRRRGLSRDELAQALIDAGYPRKAGGDA